MGGYLRNWIPQATKKDPRLPHYTRLHGHLRVIHFILFLFIFKSSLVWWYNENQEVWRGYIHTRKKKHKSTNRVKNFLKWLHKIPTNSKRSNEIIRMLTKRQLIYIYAASRNKLLNCSTLVACLIWEWVRLLNALTVLDKYDLVK